MNISVTFWLEDKCIFSSWAESFPMYQPGQSVYLSSNVTPIGKEKFPSAENFSGKFVIDNVVHSIDQSYTNDISDLFKVEVHLKQG
jgi:hypothetical protein